MAYCANVFDLLMAHYGIDRGLGDDNCAKSYDDDLPYTPKWQEQITVSRLRKLSLRRALLPLRLRKRVERA